MSDNTDFPFLNFLALPPFPPSQPPKQYSANKTGNDFNRELPQDLQDGPFRFPARWQIDTLLVWSRPWSKCTSCPLSRLLCLGPTLLDLCVSVWPCSCALDLQIFFRSEKPVEPEISSGLSVI